jgi:hypothetical protein
MGMDWGDIIIGVFVTAVVVVIAYLSARNGDASHDDT